MFFNWRQTFSKPRLVDLGTGILQVDALTGESRFNGAPIQPLSMATELRAWLERDLAEHDIPKAAVREATVRIDLSFDLIPWDQRNANSQLVARGGRAESVRMHRFVARCTSVLRTEEAEYRGRYQYVEEWPVEWPAV
jgi:hypothetical protein